MGASSATSAMTRRDNIRQRPQTAPRPKGPAPPKVLKNRRQPCCLGLNWPGQHQHPGHTDKNRHHAPAPETQLSQNQDTNQNRQQNTSLLIKAMPTAKLRRPNSITVQTVAVICAAPPTSAIAAKSVPRDIAARSLTRRHQAARIAASDGRGIDKPRKGRARG